MKNDELHERNMERLNKVIKEARDLIITIHDDNTQKSTIQRTLNVVDELQEDGEELSPLLGANLFIDLALAIAWESGYECAVNNFAQSEE